MVADVRAFDLNGDRVRGHAPEVVRHRLARDLAQRHDRRDHVLRAARGAKVRGRERRVLDDVVQHGGHLGMRAPHPRHHAQRVVDVRVAALVDLAGVCLAGDPDGVIEYETHARHCALRTQEPN
ncbi:hypothetical protein [Kibdelosporangium persicum]|uniref:hypothetical protein n=1 Tax=Kibdelosporangium persicum TaxID=2698649 RepID=UPI001FE34B9C|nr:hypothetical protein [Kibdelosporangium persicum]